MLNAKGNSSVGNRNKAKQRNYQRCRNICEKNRYVYRCYHQYEQFNLPYAVAIGGVVQDAFKNKPKRVSGSHGKIVVSGVPPGKQVSLFLNSDAHHSYRQNPVYSVTTSDRDILVEIREKAGKHSETDVPIRYTDKDPALEAAKKADTYTAVLTGDIWMKVSHKYSTSEVDALLPSDTSPLVASSVKKIYDGLTTPSLEIVVSSSSSVATARTISIKFNDGNNAHDNINSGYDPLMEGLRRVHPAGYAAIFKAAIESGVDRVVMSSCWRPLMGSIAHRAGLGLDVSFVGATKLNRQKLRNPDAVNAGNVSPEEKDLFTNFEASKAQQSEARKAVSKANTEVKKAGNVPEKLIPAKQKLKAAMDAAVVADAARKDAEAAWNAERDKNEPEQVRLFRQSLIKCPNVEQLFDPWFMDANTHDNTPASANTQHDANEKLHAHHLHITIREPNIL